MRLSLNPPTASPGGGPGCGWWEVEGLGLVGFGVLGLWCVWFGGIGGVGSWSGLFRACMAGVWVVVMVVRGPSGRVSRVGAAPGG